MERQVEFRFMTQSVNGSNAAEFMARINELLQSPTENWKVISSTPMGVDTGGGFSGSGSVMMVVSLVRYITE